MKEYERKHKTILTQPLSSGEGYGVGKEIKMIEVMYLLRELQGLSFEELVIYIQKLNRALVTDSLEPVVIDLLTNNFSSIYDNMESVIINFVKMCEAEKVDLNACEYWRHKYRDDIIAIRQKINVGYL